MSGKIRSCYYNLCLDEKKYLGGKLISSTNNNDKINGIDKKEYEEFK